MLRNDIFVDQITFYTHRCKHMEYSNNLRISEQLNGLYPNKKGAIYTVSQEFPNSVKNMLLLKNPQFLPDHYDILTKEGMHEDLILIKFRNDQIKIV